MVCRSWLIVPGNSEQALAQAARSGADAVVVDLCATVSSADKAAARAHSAEWLRAYREPASGGQGMARWVRISPFDSGVWRDDLMAAMAGAVDGIILPHSAGPEAVRQLGTELYEFEQRNGVPANATRVIPIVGENPQTALRIPDYLEAQHPRLAGLTWRPEMLAAAIGVGAPAEAQDWCDPLRLVRSICLLTARAMEGAAIDAACPAAADAQAAFDAAMRARRDGFTGMLVQNPSHVASVNAAFSGDAAAPAEHDRLVAPPVASEMPAISLQDDLTQRLRPEYAGAGAAIAASGNAASAGLMQPGLIRRTPTLRPA